MKLYTFTLSANNADSSKAFTAFLTDDEYKSVIKDIRKYTSYTYDVMGGRDVENPSNYEELLDWLFCTRLTRTEYVHVDTKVKIIQLPKHISYSTEGCLVVNIGKSYCDYTSQDVAKEVECFSWIVKTFKNVKYHKQRNTFILESTVEIHKTQDLTVRHNITISPSGNQAVERTIRVYNKITHTI